MSLKEGTLWVLNTIYDLIEDHTLEVGPLMLTTTMRWGQEGRNAFDLGVSAGARGVKPKARPSPPRQLHTV